jgi:hypothetical protein
VHAVTSIRRSGVVARAVPSYDSAVWHVIPHGLRRLAVFLYVEGSIPGVSHISASAVGVR